VRCLAPDYREERANRVLLVWGDLPFWLVVDKPAARFIGLLAEGRSLATAMRASGGAEREAAAIVARLRQAGVTGSRRSRVPKERIESISLNVTNRCNLRCTFCYNAGRVTDAEISAEQMIRGLDGLRRFIAPGAMLALLGGEPLLEKEKTLALGQWARRRKLRAIVSTNGLLVDGDFAREAAAAGMDCQVSLDGATAEAHEAVRGPDTFERAVKAVAALVGGGAHTLLSMVVHAGNVAEIPDFVRLAQRLEVHEARFIPVKRLGGGDSFALPDLAGLCGQVVRLVRDEPELGTLLGRDYVSILAHTCQTCSPRRGCGTGSQTLLLDADGSVYPCPNLTQPQFAAGSIVTDNPADLWRHSNVLASVRALAKFGAGHACGECFLRHWCLGGCRGETYALTGDLSARPPACDANRAAVVEMFWTLSSCPGLVRPGRRYC
jgi:radical SAM protein with 4Fe4S-binding SPASM domain